MRILLVAALFALSTQASATDPAGNVTNDTFFGQGNSNGDFTIVQDGGVEVGIRGKVAFDGSTNWDGKSTYTFPAGTPDFSDTRAIWNFDYSINTDFDDSDNLGGALSNYFIVMQLDIDSGVGQSLVSFNALLFGGSLGTNATTGDDGTAFTDPSQLANFNIIQGSQNFGFYTDQLSFDPNKNGDYTISISVFNADEAGAITALLTETPVNPNLPRAVASSSITVRAVPEPATWLMMIAGFALTGFALKRRRGAVAAAA